MQNKNNTTSINDFIIEQKPIGEGSFGKVYRASLKGDQKNVFAVKYIGKKGKTKKDIDGFKCQTQIMKKLQHPNIINLKCVFETPQHLIIVMEYAQTDFSKLMQDRKKLPIEEVKKYGYQILEALLYLKQHKIIHRDLKPQNILFHNGQIKLCDFGFAKQMNASNAFVYSLKGTPLYIAPQISKQKPYNFKVDVWAFGVILFELFVGKQPFYATTWHKLIPKIQNNPVTFPESMPKQLRSVINGMLHKDANSRFDYQQIKTHAFFLNAQEQYLIALKSKPENETPGNEDVPRFENSQVKIVVLSQISNNPQYGSTDQKQQQKPQEDFGQLVKDIDQAASQILDGKEGAIEFATKKKTDQLFGLKLLSLFQIKIKDQHHVSKETLSKVFKILVFMISKIKSQKSDSQDEDITKNLAVAFSVIKIAQKEEDFQLLQQQITLLGLIVKNNFNSMQVDMDTEDKVRFLIVKLLEKSKLRQLQVNDVNQSLIPKKIIINGLKIIGVLANQGLLTLESSLEFFENCEQSHLLKTIAECYQANPQYFIILDLLQKFVHPTLQLKNQQCVLSYQKQQIFKRMKEQVAEALVTRNFIHPQKSPFNIYMNANEIECYFEILYECMKVSKSMRERYQKYEHYWLDMLGKKRLQAFALANNDLLIKFEKVNSYNNSIVKSIDIQQQKEGDRQIIKLLLVKNAFFNYSRKADSKMKTESGMMILNQALQLLKTEQNAKFKCIKYLQGTLLSNKYSLFDEHLLEMICLIAEKELLKQQRSQQGLLQILETCYYNMKSNIERDSFRLSQQRIYQFLGLISQCKGFNSLQESFQKKLHSSFLDLVNAERMREIEIKYGKQFALNYFLKLYEFLKLGPIFNSSMSNRGTAQQQAYQKIIQKCLQVDIHVFLFENFELLLKKGFYVQQQKIAHSVSFLNKIMNSGASKSQKNSIIDFIGFQVLPHFSNFIINNRKFSAQLIIEIIILISFLTKFKPDFDEIIFETGIISSFTGLLLEKFYNISNPAFKQVCIDKTLNLIGNLMKSKKPEKFFDHFRQHKVLWAVRKTMEEYSNNKKILKNGIFAIGNISFWNDSFVQEIIPVFHVFRQLLAEGNNNDDEIFINNLVSTLSNLVRHSAVCLDALLKSQIIYNVLKIYMIQNKLETKRNYDQFKFCWNFIKKCLNVGGAFEKSSSQKFRIMKDPQFYKLIKQLVQCKKEASVFKDGGTQFKNLCQMVRI